MTTYCAFAGSRRAGLHLYQQAGGLGSRGERNPDESFLKEDNAVIILACEEAQAERLIVRCVPG